MKAKCSVGRGAACLLAAMFLAAFILIPVMKVYAVEAYKVGAVFSVTGRASFLGDPEKKTALMLEEEINKKGGINGHPLELVVYDDEGDSTKCALAVRKLITQDKGQYMDRFCRSWQPPRRCDNPDRRKNRPGNRPI